MLFRSAPKGTPASREDLRAAAFLDGEERDNLTEHVIGEVAEVSDVVEISSVSASIVFSRSGIGRCRRWCRSRIALDLECG